MWGNGVLLTGGKLRTEAACKLLTSRCPHNSVWRLPDGAATLRRIPKGLSISESRSTDSCVAG